MLQSIVLHYVALQCVAVCCYNSAAVCCCSVLLQSVVLTTHYVYIIYTEDAKSLGREFESHLYV